MAKKGKRYREIKEQVDRFKLHTVDEAVSLLKNTSKAKFDETVDLASRPGCGRTTKPIRISVALSHSHMGRVNLSVLSFLPKGDPARQAEEAWGRFCRNGRTGG